jgi:hypothetical protein
LTLKYHVLPTDKPDTVAVKAVVVIVLELEKPALSAYSRI